MRCLDWTGDTRLTDQLLGLAGALMLVALFGAALVLAVTG